MIHMREVFKIVYWRTILNILIGYRFVFLMIVIVIGAVIFVAGCV